MEIDGVSEVYSTTGDVDLIAVVRVAPARGPGRRHRRPDQQDPGHARIADPHRVPYVLQRRSGGRLLHRSRRLSATARTRRDVTGQHAAGRRHPAFAATRPQHRRRWRTGARDTRASASSNVGYLPKRPVRILVGDGQGDPALSTTASRTGPVPRRGPHAPPPRCGRRRPRAARRRRPARSDPDRVDVVQRDCPSRTQRTLEVVATLSSSSPSSPRKTRRRCRGRRTPRRSGRRPAGPRRPPRSSAGGPGWSAVRGC